MKQILALAAFAAMTVTAASSAMANDSNVAISVGVPGQVYVNAQSGGHPPVSSREVYHEPVSQHGPNSYRERHGQYYAPAHVQSGYRQDVHYGRRPERHQYVEERPHEQERVRYIH